MPVRMTRRRAMGLALGAGVAGALSRPVIAGTAMRPVFRISTENTDEHFHTHVVRRFSERLHSAVGDRLDIRFHPGGTLSRDRDVIDGMRQGKIEMAVPGTWQVDRYAPDAAIFNLPMSYGRGMEEVHAILDGPLGERLNRSLNQDLFSEVIGGWMDLGHGGIFGAGRPVQSYEDIVGKRIRIPGGVAHARRIQALGATPILIPWSELPGRLDSASVAGLLSTSATVVSAALWEHGVESAFLDQQYLAHYVPLVRKTLWARLPESLKTVIRQVWREALMEGRSAAVQAQNDAVSVLIQNGVKITVPDAETRTVWRKKLMAEQDGIIADLGMTGSLVSDVMHALESAG